MKTDSNNIMKAREILIPDQLVNELLLLRDDSYIFRGQPDSKHPLLPSAFRGSVIKNRLEKFPATSYINAWSLSEEIIETILPPFPKEYIHSLHANRIKELTFYIMHYNYFLATHVQNNKKKFDAATLKMYELRPPSFWTEKETFIRLFQYGFEKSIGRITDDGKIINHSIINEEMASYDESLPQHYDTQTAALDFSINPLKALYFSTKGIPNDATHISIFAYKESQKSDRNPIIIKQGHPECENPRIIQQEGLFLTFRYASLYYFLHGQWPSVESFFGPSGGTFELIKFIIPVNQADKLRSIISQKGITEKSLLLE
ncbi:MAG TPA: FRG domain-containing protein [Gammaproteobacteria bacterium]|nr:FRG domain-containing protein [Gammaproteobacteria bacterium]